MNKSILLKSLHIYFFIYAMIFCGCQHTIKVQNEVKECTKGDLKNETIHSVAIKLPFLFYPERWCLNDSKLYVLNSRINPFLTIYNLQENSYIQYGNIGQGPKEFIVPSLCEMKEPEKIGIYSNSMNKLDVLHFNSDSLLYVKTLHFPLWNKQRGIPKAYTRLIQYNDSLFIGTSFMPKEISVELMNLKTEKVVNSVNFPLKPKEGEYSRPYECKIATEMNFIVAAYRYINRLEIYKLSDQKFQLNTIIGDANNQYDLYRLNKDNEMILHYSMTVCGKNQIYALYRGVKEKELSSANSKIEVYSYDGTHLRTFDLGRSIEKILVDESSMRIYAFDRNEEKDIVFCYAIESNT